MKQRLPGELDDPLPWSDLQGPDPQGPDPQGPDPQGPDPQSPGRGTRQRTNSDAAAITGVKLIVTGCLSATLEQAESDARQLVDSLRGNPTAWQGYCEFMSYMTAISPDIKPGLGRRAVLFALSQTLGAKDHDLGDGLDGKFNVHIRYSGRPDDIKLYTLDKDQRALVEQGAENLEIALDHKPLLLIDANEGLKFRLSPFSGLDEMLKVTKQAVFLDHQQAWRRTPQDDLHVEFATRKRVLNHDHARDEMLQFVLASLVFAVQAR